MKNNNGDQKGLLYLFIIHVCFPFELWYEYLHLIYTFLSEHDGIIIQKKYKISKDLRTLWISRLWITRRDGNACSMLLVLIFLPNNVGMASMFKTSLHEIPSCHFVLVVNVNISFWKCCEQTSCELLFRGQLQRVLEHSDPVNWIAQTHLLLRILAFENVCKDIYLTCIKNTVKNNLVVW